MYVHLHVLTVGWGIKHTKSIQIDAFELWCWRRLLRVPWTARRSNQSILKEISPGCSLEGMMLKLKLQNFGHLMRRVDSLEKTLCWEGLGAGGKGDDRGWDGWMASPTQWTWVWVNSGRWWWTGRPGVLWFMGSQRVGHDWATELNWTKLKGFQVMWDILKSVRMALHCLLSSYWLASFLLSFCLPSPLPSSHKAGVTPDSRAKHIKAESTWVFGFLSIQDYIGSKIFCLSS